MRSKVFQHLRRQILEGKLYKGQRLIESDIANDLKVSRTPVREAFLKLETEGLVQYSPGRGVTVSQLSNEDMLELYSIRRVLEGLVASFAAEKITKEELNKLKTLLKEMDSSYKRADYKSTVQLHTQFNELIFQAAHSSRLYEMVVRFHEYTERSQMRSLSLPERFQAIQKEHRQIVEALEKGNPKVAEEVVRYHVEQARFGFLETLSVDQFLEELTA